MNKSIIIKRILYILIPLALVAIVVIQLKNNKETSEGKVFQFDKEEPIPIEADTVELENVAADFSYIGTFEPSKESRISAEIQGKINAVLVDLGSMVRKGQSLIMLDNSLLKLQLQAIEVQIEGLEADVNRFTILANADAIQGVQLEKATLGLKAANVQKQTILEQINKTTIKAPFDGVVTAKLNEEGAFAAPGIPLLQISDIRNLKFTINVSENDLRQFKLNEVYAISSDTYSGVPLKGRAIMIGSKANMGSSFPVQFSLNNTADYIIKSGMFGKVSSVATGMEKGIEEKGIVIQAAVIVGTTDRPQVYVVKNGKSVLQNITISKRIQNKAVISSGLNVGDVIVTNGFINLFEGANVSYH